MGRYTIKKIVIKNLKHFKGDFPIELDGKNLLLYGDNGSGKSSIYWALHMFYQSCLKTQDKFGAGKYFDADNAENLRNIYAPRMADSGVELTFEDALGVKKTYEDSNVRINTAPTATDEFIRFSLQNSDFLSYKSLATLYDFRNSQLCDLTKLFEREIFPSMYFAEKLKDLDGNVIDESNISKWADAMVNYFALLPRRSKNSKVIKVGTPQNMEFGKLLAKYNELLKDFLDDISKRTNRILSDDFKVLYSVELKREEARYNQKYRDPGSKRSNRDNTLILPKILLKMKWKDNTLPSPGHEISVNHPQSFFNEAKLSIAAFAIRLAIVEMKFAGTSSDSAPILCIDDLLISLDMGNRIPMAERILKCASDYQMFIFTHDRSLYNLFTSLIPKDDLDEKWLRYELYNVLDDMYNPSSENPHLCMSKSYMEKAKSSWQDHDIPAAVNYLRKEAEKQLKRLYPHNMQITLKKGWLSLGNMLEKMPDFVKLYALPSNPIAHMNYFRSRLLNPLSHDDYNAPIYSNELRMCIQELSDLATYEKGVVVECNDLSSTQFELLMTSGGASFSVLFVCVDKWDYCYVHDTPIPRYYKNADVKVISSTDTRVVAICNAVPIKNVYKKVYTHLGYSETTAPIMDQVIIRVSDSKRLCDI